MPPSERISIASSPEGTASHAFLSHRTGPRSVNRPRLPPRCYVPREPAMQACIFQNARAYPANARAFPGGRRSYRRPEKKKKLHLRTATVFVDRICNMPPSQGDSGQLLVPTWPQHCCLKSEQSVSGSYIPLLCEKRLGANAFVRNKVAAMQSF